MTVNGKPAFYCPVCNRFVVGVAVVAPPKRKNKRGRIAWSRDGICAECERKEKKQCLNG